MPDNQQPSAVVTGTGIVDLFTKQYGTFSKGLVESMREISQLADKRASTFLLALGTVLLFLVMFWRLRPAGIEISSLEPSEFITMAIISGLFVLGGALMRLYQDYMISAANKEIRATGAALLGKTQEAAIALAQKGTEPNPLV